MFGEQLVAVDDGGGEVDEFAVAGAGVLAQQVEGAALVDGVAFHQDALGALGQRATSERAFEVVGLGEAAQHDVDREAKGSAKNAVDMVTDSLTGRKRKKR